jgi:hypothetical protein
VISNETGIVDVDVMAMLVRKRAILYLLKGAEKVEYALVGPIVGKLAV